MMNKNNGDKTVLTPELKAKINENRRIALEKLQKRRLNVANPLSRQNFENKVLPTKEIQSINRLVPYTKPNSIIQKSFPTITHNSTTSSLPTTAPKEELKIKCEFIIQNEKRFIVKVQYDKDIIDVFKTMKTGRYNPEIKSWSFDFREYNDLTSSLAKIKRVQLDKLKDFIVKAMMKQEEEPNESCLEQIESELVSTLLDFQRKGIAYGVSRNGRCLIADDMGLGKSRQALGIADYYRDDWPLLIVTNASTREFWAKEITELLPKVLFHEIIILQNNNEAIYREKVVICSYWNLHEQSVYTLMQKNFGVIIFDESHNLKNAKAKQTENAKKLAEKARRVIMVTGTPALSRPVELFPQLDMIDGKFADFYDFTKRYCRGMQTKFGWNATGATHLDELKILLTKKFMIRRIKSEVFSELINKNRHLVTLENYKIIPTKNDEMVKFFTQFGNENSITKDNEGVLIQWYQRTAEEKAFGAFTFVKKYLENNDCKILIFAHHNIMMTYLCAELEKIHINFIKIDGTTKGEARSERVASFQDDPNIRVAVLSIRSCNAGITLTRASTVIFCELDWNPSTLIQAEARAHRIGQENEVNVYYLIAPKTADEFIWRILSEKQKHLGKAGLMAEVENLVSNIKNITFNVRSNVQVASFLKNRQEETASSLAFFENRQHDAPQSSYVFDDEEEEAEIMKFLDTLPFKF